MARSKSTFVINIEYYLVRGLATLLGLLPERWAQSLAYVTLRCVLFFIPKRRELMRSNIARAFPDLRSRQHKAIARESLANLARGTAMFVRMPQILSRKDPPWLHIEGVTYLEKALQAGKGALPITAHYGFWELMSSWTLKSYPKVAAVYRPLDNPRIDTFVKEIRCSGGGSMMDRRDVLRQALRWLKQNGVLGFLIDQNFAAGGVFVNFFGRPAATTPAISILARRTGAAILPVHNRWEGKTLRIIWEKPLVLSRHTDPERAVAEDTQAMTSIVERWVREEPGQWLWLHNRWKRQALPGEEIR